MHTERRQAGDRAEQLVVEFLERHGFTIRDRNVLARRGELDIVAERGLTLAFVEVRSTATDIFGDPSGTVTRAKQRKVALAAHEYCQRNRLYQRVIRFDVASVVGSRVELIEDAFDAPFASIH
ncbi:MAG: YraN family protein [Archangium sp.]|nr:YraN family protein [Archangium sp.]